MAGKCVIIPERDVLIKTFVDTSVFVPSSIENKMW